MIPLRSPRSRRVATLRIIAVGIAAMLGMLTTPSHARAQKALVYCPVGIDVAGCTNLVAALQPVFPSGVDRGYDGSGGTVDLRVANLWGYSLIAIPSLATTGGATPYAILSDTAMGSRLHDAVLGRVALWSGTPDLGSPNGTQKDTLIQNLGRWAAASYGAVKGPGLVVFQDMSDSIATQYGWLHVIAGTAIQGDSTVSTHATVQGVTPTGTSLLRDPSGNAIAYANMAAFGFLLPGSGSGFTVDGVAVSGAGTQNVLLTSLGGNTGSATIATDADDYAPGTIVTITGSGFGPGETVTISLHERPFFDTPATITAVADKVGSFVDRSFSPDSADLDVRFVATAVGTSSGLRAVTTFTDAAPSTVVVQTQTPAPVISGSDATFVVFVKMGGNTGSCTAGLSATPSSNPAWPGTGVTFTFNPASVTGVSNQLIPTTLTVHTPPAMSPNTYHFSVSASGACQGNGTQTASGNGDLIVAPAVVTGNATISSSTSTSTFGQSVTFTATVTPASGTSTPTGSIQFLDNGTNLGAAVPLAGGVANVSTATLGAGSHTISATYTPGTGFAAGSVSSLTQTVNKATPSITWGVPSAVNYGTALSAAQLNATANPGAGTFTYTPAPGALLDAGTQTLSVTFTPTDGADYNPASTSVALTVNRLAATVTADNQTRVFGQPNPTLTGALTGFLPADNISATYATTATPTSDVGNYAITPTLVDPNGRLGNYAVTPAAGTLRIDKADQTISFAQPADPTFGESPVTLAATASSGLPVAFGATGACTVSGSSLSIGGAGSCVVTASQSGDQNHNGAPNVVYTLTVKKAAPSVSAQGGAFTYDGLTHAATVGATGVGGAALTPVTVTYNGSSMLPKNAGTYTVLVSFAGSSDYLAGSANATITIGQKALTVTADDKSKVYGGATPSFTATYAGFVTGEGPADLSGSVTFGGTATSAVDAGTYTIAPSGVTSQNYAITFGNGTLIISKAPLSVKAADQSRVYGDPDPAFTGTLTGVVNNDNITATYATTAALGSDIGSYPVTPTLVDPSSRLPNYSVASTDGVLTITKAPLTIAASSATRLYGGANPAFTGTITGTKNGDAITASYSTNATPLDNVGSYAIVPAAVDPSPSRIGNYAVTLTNGTLSITPAPLTVAANASTKVYGDANPSFSVTYTGFVNSEAASVLGGTLAFTTAANNTTGVGSVSVTPSGLTSTNYDVTFTAGQLTITPAPLTITAGNANRLYGAMNPTFTGSITGIKNGDAIAATYATAATAATDVGTYPIVPTAVDANPAKLLNYSVAVTNGTLTINPAPLSVTPTNASVIQGDHLPALLGVVAGIVNGDPITASYATTAVTLPYVSSAAGPYDITASLVDPNQRAGNYVVTLNKATLTILANAPPVLGTLTAPSAPVQIGTAITASATFTDVDVTASTPYPSSIDWGDGQTTSGPLDAPGTVTGTHSYAAAGVYTIAISVADKINTSPVTHYFQYVVVYDPSAGFVTGGGWINSPPAACQLSSACAGATGKATFGFNARYQRGANTPDGSTEFQFQAGGLNFKSTTYQWLVVAGSKAQYKGVGSINGKGAYNFLLTAIDGDLQSGKADAFRIKITDSSTGSVVYDNQMGSDDTSSNATVLGGGSIVIHQ